MKNIKHKFDNAGKALNALQRALARDWQNDQELRDAVIQRFEFTVETCWKAYQAYFEREGVEIGTPKAVFRQMLSSNIVDQTEIEKLLEMVDDRNQSSHTYNEELAEEISQKIPMYFELLKSLILKMVS